jgi:hypothetical protein
LAIDAHQGRALVAWRFICDREEWDWNDLQRRTSVWSGLLEDVFFDASAVSPREWEDLAARLEEFAANPKRNDPAGAVPAAIRGY